MKKESFGLWRRDWGWKYPQEPLAAAPAGQPTPHGERLKEFHEQRALDALMGPWLKRQLEKGYDVKVVSVIAKGTKPAAAADELWKAGLRIAQAVTKAYQVLKLPVESGATQHYRDGMTSLEDVAVASGQAIGIKLLKHYGKRLVGAADAHPDRKVSPEVMERMTSILNTYLEYFTAAAETLWSNVAGKTIPHELLGKIHAASRDVAHIIQDLALKSGYQVGPTKMRPVVTVDRVLARFSGEYLRKFNLKPGDTVIVDYMYFNRMPHPGLITHVFPQNRQAQVQFPWGSERHDVTTLIKVRGGVVPTAGSMTYYDSFDLAKSERLYGEVLGPRKVTSECPVQKKTAASAGPTEESFRREIEELLPDPKGDLLSTERAALDIAARMRNYFSQAMTLRFAASDVRHLAEKMMERAENVYKGAKGLTPGMVHLAKKFKEDVHGVLFKRIHQGMRPHLDALFHLLWPERTVLVKDPETGEKKPEEVPGPPHLMKDPNEMVDLILSQSDQIWAEGRALADKYDHVYTSAFKERVLDPAQRAYDDVVKGQPRRITKLKEELVRTDEAFRAHKEPSDKDVEEHSERHKKLKGEIAKLESGHVDVVEIKDILADGLKDFPLLPLALKDDILKEIRGFATPQELHNYFYRNIAIHSRAKRIQQSIEGLRKWVMEGLLQRGKIKVPTDIPTTRKEIDDWHAFLKVFQKHMHKLPLDKAKEKFQEFTDKSGLKAHDKASIKAHIQTVETPDDLSKLVAHQIEHWDPKKHRMQMFGARGLLESAALNLLGACDLQEAKECVATAALASGSIRLLGCVRAAGSVRVVSDALWDEIARIRRSSTLQRRAGGTYEIRPKPGTTEVRVEGAHGVTGLPTSMKDLIGFLDKEYPHVSFLHMAEDQQVLFIHHMKAHKRDPEKMVDDSESGEVLKHNFQAWKQGVERSFRAFNQGKEKLTADTVTEAIKDAEKEVRALLEKHKGRPALAAGLEAILSFLKDVTLVKTADVREGIQNAAGKLHGKGLPTEDADRLRKLARNIERGGPPGFLAGVQDFVDALLLPKSDRASLHEYLKHEMRQSFNVDAMDVLLTKYIQMFSTFRLLETGLGSAVKDYEGKLDERALWEALLKEIHIVRSYVGKHVPVTEQEHLAIMVPKIVGDKVEWTREPVYTLRPQKGFESVLFDPDKPVSINEFTAWVLHRMEHKGSAKHADKESGRVGVWRSEAAYLLMDGIKAHAFRPEIEVKDPYTGKAQKVPGMHGTSIHNYLEEASHLVQKKIHEMLKAKAEKAEKKTSAVLARFVNSAGERLGYKVRPYPPDVGVENYPRTDQYDSPWQWMRELRHITKIDPVVQHGGLPPDKVVFLRNEAERILDSAGGMEELLSREVGEWIASHKPKRGHLDYLLGRIRDLRRQRWLWEPGKPVEKWMLEGAPA